MRGRPSFDDRAAVFAATSRLLQYPDQALLECLGSIEEAAARLPSDARAPLESIVRYIRATSLLELQAAYVETFDLRQRNCLYLTFARAGDTRRRGMALWEFADLYRRHGYTLATTELPDFLPLLLELAADSARDDREPFEVLVRHRPEIVLLGASLATDGSPYADAVRALEWALPRPTQAVLEAARKMAEEGPPEEQVGAMPDFRWLGQPGPAGKPTDGLEMEEAPDMMEMLEVRR